MILLTFMGDNPFLTFFLALLAAEVLIAFANALGNLRK